MTRLTTRFALRLARTDMEIGAAQALRHRVFVEELGAQGGELTKAGFEADRFDRHCEHLLLLDSLQGGAVIGTTRLATEAAAMRAGGFATEQEFDLWALRRSGRRLLEVGRTCIDPGYRGGDAVHRLWQGLASIVEERGIEVLFGLASFRGTNPAAIEQALAWLHHDHLAPGEMRPRSLDPVPMDRVAPEEVDRRAAVLATPPLVKGYLRMGARAGEGAYLDPDFGCLDVCMVLETAQLSARARAIYGAPPA